VDTVTETVSAIQSDLTQIKDAREDLSDERRQEIESANQAFESQVKGVVKDIGTSLTASDAASTISSAVQQLADSYEQTFARIDCS
jgi:ribosomal protein S20